MKRILLFGAGKSATVLIDYLLSHAEQENWKLILADTNLALATDKLGGSPFGVPVSFDVMDDDKRGEEIRQADLVISMLPPALHSKVATDCIKHGKHLLTASYIDDEMRRMEADINNKSLLFLCEMGLDPGIDHMSAMKLIDDIHEKNGRVVSFKSHCGGLVAPESDDNPWHYKISWNPRNIVLAGKAGAVFRKEGRPVHLEYEDVFNNCETINIPQLGELAFYPNRDSLSYIPLYGLEQASTFLRTTLRYPAFCKAWNGIVKARLTDEDRASAAIASKHINYSEWVEKSIALFTESTGTDDFLQQVAGPDKELVKALFDYLGLLSDEGIPITATCSADVLQFAIERKLTLFPHDKDMIVMLHELEYEQGGKTKTVKSTLIVKGEDSLNTAMAKTVGLPLGIAARLLLNGTITSRGLLIPTSREIYQPVLQELESQGILFKES